LRDKSEKKGPLSIKRLFSIQTAIREMYYQLISNFYYLVIKNIRYIQVNLVS
jgi:hypothetical protein